MSATAASSSSHSPTHSIAHFFLPAPEHWDQDEQQIYLKAVEKASRIQTEIFECLANIVYAPLFQSKFPQLAANVIKLIHPTTPILESATEETDFAHYGSKPLSKYNDLHSTIDQIVWVANGLLLPHLPTPNAESGFLCEEDTEDKEFLAYIKSTLKELGPKMGPMSAEAVQVAAEFNACSTDEARYEIACKILNTPEEDSPSAAYFTGKYLTLFSMGEDMTALAKDVLGMLSTVFKQKFFPKSEGQAR